MLELVLYFFAPVIVGAFVFLVGQVIFYVMTMTWNILLNFFRNFI